MTRTLASETSRLAAENQSRAHTEVELERAIRMRDRFLDDLTRELAAPVAGLTAEIEALAGVSPAYERRGRDERTASAALVRHVKRLGSVVEQLKEVSRITNRQTAIPLESIDLCDVARQIALRNRERMAAMGSGVVFHTEPRIQGQWDRRRLEQLLTNLLLSAARLRRGPSGRSGARHRRWLGADLGALSGRGPIVRGRGRRVRRWRAGRREPDDRALGRRPRRAVGRPGDRQRVRRLAAPARRCARKQRSGGDLCRASPIRNARALRRARATSDKGVNA